MPIATSMLGPVIGLNLWTFFVEGWMYATRVPAVKKYKAPLHPSVTKEEFNAPIPPSVRWKADNYNHLMEQPTQFYAVALTLAFLGVESKVDVGLAWTYVGIRVLHSLVQVLTNRIPVRFVMFLMSSGVLLGMTIRAGLVLGR